MFHINGWVRYNYTIVYHDQLQEYGDVQGYLCHNEKGS